MSSSTRNGAVPGRKKPLHIVLFDVSYSMRAPLKLRSNAQDANKGSSDLDPKRVQSVFDVICRLAEDGIHNAQSQDMYTAILAFGLRHVAACDLLAFLEERAKVLELLDSVEKTSNSASGFTYAQAAARLATCGINGSEAAQFIQSSRSSTSSQQTHVIIGHRPLINLLARAGAPYCEKYVHDHLDAEKAGKYFLAFSAPERRNDLLAIVQRLPDACKEFFSAQRFVTNNTGFLGRAVSGVAAEEAIDQAERLLATYKITSETGVPERDPSIVSLLQSIPIATPKPLVDVVQLIKRLKSATIQRSPSADKSHVDWVRLLDDIEPYLYGNTPMCHALSTIWPLTLQDEYSSKVVILISDGDSTDGNPLLHAARIRDAGATIFACLLTDAIIDEPRRIRSENEEVHDLTSAALAMFRMASAVSYDSGPIQALRRRGWQLPTSGLCKCFIQANNPLIIDEFTAASKSLGTSSDALANLVGEVSLDTYIQSVNADAKASHQRGRAICWAHAIASTIHLASARVVGREVLEIFHIRSRLLKLFGDNDDGQSVGTVLGKVCPSYHLQYQKCNEAGAIAAIQVRRPVIATFALDEKHWDCFGDFYKSNPRGTLTAQDMNVPVEGEIGGHAVVLVRCDESSLTFMNSWGTKFGNNGFFTVDRAATLEVPGGSRMRFYDIYWTTDDLSHEEITAWKEHKSKTISGHIEELPTSFHELPVDCPHCKRPAPARNYDGSWNCARCRSCRKTFTPTVQALIRSLYDSNYDH